MNRGLKIGKLARRAGVTAKAMELDRKLKDLRDVRRRIGKSLAAWQRRPPKKATVCPHIETDTGSGRRQPQSNRRGESWST